MPHNTQLESNSNFFITSFYGDFWYSILDLEIDIEFFTDRTVARVDKEDLGMSIQLNCISPKGFNSSWQQYTMSQQGNEIREEVQNWCSVNDKNYSSGFIVSASNICSLPAPKIPSGYHLKIALANDEFGNIQAVTFRVVDAAGKISAATEEIRLFPRASEFGCAPIIGFQLVFTGLGDGSTAFFEYDGFGSGVGTITYTASTPLSARVLDQAGYGGALIYTMTAEKSNMTYRQMSPSKSKKLTQGFSVAAPG